jgi:tripartite-type tricarboxylate transporter receptor subunit TctC
MPRLRQAWPRRAFLRAAGLAAVAPLLAPNARAQPAWPARTVRIVVPSPPGSGIDMLARMLAQRLAPAWGQAVVVDNRAGANSLIGAEAVAHAAPDGYTLLFASDVTFTLNPHLYRKLPYDPLRDFVPVVQVATFRQVLVAHPSLNARTLADVIAAARARPGMVSYASFGVGSTAHLLSELLARQAGIDLLHVPYKGIGPAVAAVVAGEAMLTWAGVYSTAAHVRAERLRGIAIAAPRRSPLLPDVPSAAEAGYPILDLTSWFGLFAPAATPSAIVARVQRDVAHVLADAQVDAQELRARGYESGTLAGAAFAARIRQELEARAALVRIADARLD